MKTYEAMKAAVDAAHMRGLKVATHAYAAAEIKDAVRAVSLSPFRPFAEPARPGFASPSAQTRASPTVAAEMFGLEKDVGAVAPGFLADLIAMKADPLADVAAVRNPDFVMKAGRIAKRDGQMVPAEDWAAGSRHP